MENYDRIKIIGEGTYGEVVQCIHKASGLTVAIKRFKRPEDEDKTALREVNLLLKLSHPNVVTLFEVFFQNNVLFAVFEYVDFTVLNVIEWSYPYGVEKTDAKKIIWQLLVAIEYCHKNNIIHRDIKPENLLLTKNSLLKLCDFGFARECSKPGENAAYTEYVATRWYRSPELLLGSNSYDKSVDIWATGCLFAELLLGRPLFAGESDIEQLAKIVKVLGPMPDSKSTHLSNFKVSSNQSSTFESLLSDFDPDCISFIKQCINYIPEERGTCTQLLQHPMFNEIRETFPRQLQDVALFERAELREKLAKARAAQPLFASHIKDEQLIQYDSYYTND